jgi:hypothetical protein
MGLDLAALLTCPVCEGQLERAVCQAEVVHYRCPDCDGDRHRSALVELREWLQEVAGRPGSVLCTLRHTQPSGPRFALTRPPPYPLS